MVATSIIIIIIASLLGLRIADDNLPCHPFPAQCTGKHTVTNIPLHQWMANQLATHNILLFLAGVKMKLWHFCWRVADLFWRASILITPKLSSLDSMYFFRQCQSTDPDKAPIFHKLVQDLMIQVPQRYSNAKCLFV